jgi:hypothetical protein
MTTTTSHRHATMDTARAIVPATRTPRISDLIPGSVIFRWATPRTPLLVSELPCHADQIASVIFDPKAKVVQVDQPVVCRRCFTTYAATPVPAASDDDQPKIVYRHTGRVTMSRPKRSSE